MYKQGEIVLIPIPFTDLSSHKKRPVLILSNNNYNEQTDDLIVAAITSNIRGIASEVIIDNDDMISGKLKKTSCIRADKIYTLSKQIIVKKFGEVKLEKSMKTRNKLIDIIS